MALLTKGARVQLIPTTVSKSGKQSHNIVLLDVPTATTVPSGESTSQVSVTRAHKAAIAADIETSAKLYRFCFEQASLQMDGLIDDPALLKDIASTLFIQALRR